MKIAAAYALAELAREDGISCERILPDPFDERVVPAVANAVALAAREAGVARI
jgi:malate dehydrogenase (oxaloacetate-decarboxylating)